MKFKAQIITILLLLIASISLVFLLFYSSRIKPVKVSNRPLVLVSFLYEHGEEDLAKNQREKTFQNANDLYRAITGDSGLIDMTEDISAFKYVNKSFYFAFPLEQFIATVDLSRELNNYDFSYSRALENRSAEKFIYIDQDQNYDLYFKTKNHSKALIINGEEKSTNSFLSSWGVIDNYHSEENKILTFESASQDDQIVEVVLAVNNQSINRDGQRKRTLGSKNGSYFFDFGDEDYVITHNPKNIFLSPISCDDNCENPKFISYYSADDDSVFFNKKSMNIVTNAGYYHSNNYNFSRNLLISIFILILDIFLVLLIINKNLQRSVVLSLASIKNKLKDSFHDNRIKIIEIVFLDILLIALRFLPLFRPYLSMVLILLVNVFLIWIFFRSKRLLSFLAVLSMLIVATLNSLYLFEDLTEKFATAVVFLLVFILLESFINLLSGSAKDR